MFVAKTRLHHADIQGYMDVIIIDLLADALSLINIKENGKAMNRRADIKERYS